MLSVAETFFCKIPSVTERSRSERCHRSLSGVEVNDIPVAELSRSETVAQLILKN